MIRVDLLELNDIYCKDRTRIEHDKFFTDPVRVEYSFTPTEEHVMCTGDGRIHAVVNRPFVGISSMSFNHSLEEFVDAVHGNMPVTDHLFGACADICQSDLSNTARREQIYGWACEGDLQLHPDLSFSDVIPGMTIITDRFKNSNYEFTKDYANEEQNGHTIGNIEQDGRALSLIYILSNGNRRIGYGNIIYMGRGLKSLCDELKIYLFSNTYIVSRASEMKRLPNVKVMKTSCVVIYEDSLKRILKSVEQEKE